MKLKPLADRVLIQPTPAEETTLAGIITVSYTHLDVYKRQILDNGRRRCRHSVGKHIAFLRRERFRDRAASLDEF